MPKPKQFLKDDSRKKKSAKHAPQVPETADEFLAAGVDHEEAGEKWRGGDAAKSTRFFVRAIDTYEAGLTKFPDSFDLAYNKARVQYEITQHPKLRGQLPGNLLDLLHVALESSRRALSLKQDDPNVIFNTAQLLTSLAEALDDVGSDAGSLVPLLEEAVELFQRCLTLQEFRFSESEALRDSINADDAPGSPPDSDGGAPLTPAAQAASLQPSEEQWASIVEPTTPDTLLDTILALLETLTVLASKLDSRGLAALEEYTSTLLTKLPTYLAPSPTRAPELGLTRANLLSALAEAGFRAGTIDTATYERAITGAFRDLDLAADPKGLTDKADAMLAFAAALRTQPVEDGQQQIVTRWGALTQAGSALGAASKLPGAMNLARIHLARGDAEMLRFRVKDGTGYPGNVDAGVLVKNAGVFYRGAARQALVDGLEGVGREGRLKGALAAAVGGESEALREMVGSETGMVIEVLWGAVSDGLVEMEWLQREKIV
ncbi:hypothetical protein GMDG_07429 [Pseudogymnoascus destructans 20631-21]|uniref:Uncharacterized protein n=2 Tax=Pseudogymnoascus destructans TaxID=655981 RepID=L8FX96_PSED2|nr:hypothetical protein GMDG_07429 [Pseudogymnoascus destructans 20631-21]